jgi:hypothetical protein
MQIKNIYTGCMILVILLLSGHYLSVITPAYGKFYSKKSTIKSLSTIDVEKDQSVSLPVYLDSANLSDEEIELMIVKITFDETVLEVNNIEFHNSILSNYTFSYILQMAGQAIVRIHGSGKILQAGLIVEFIFTTVNEGITNVSIDTLTCNDYNVSGGFWVNEDYFQCIFIKVTEPSQADIFYISTIEDITICEDKAVNPIQFTLNIPEGYASGFFGLSVNSSNNQLIPRNNFRIERFDTGGYLYVIPSANTFGVSDISITAVYGIYQDTQTFTITILPVNDPPFFSMPSQLIELKETSGPQLFTHWVQKFSAGPDNESEQLLECITTVDEPSLFYKRPEIDLSTGDLRFFPVDNLNGAAVVSVYLKDNGGTENGGLNISEPQLFTLNIVPFSPELSDNPVDQLIYITTNQPISIQDVSSYIRIVTCDENGQPVAVESDVQIWLSTKNSTSGWFKSKNSTWQKSDFLLVIPEGECSALFQFRSDEAGNWIIEASEVPYQGWLEATLSIRVNGLLGDIDSNGVIDLKDIIVGLNVITGFVHDYSFNISRNGTIDLEDIIFAMKKLSF